MMTAAVQPFRGSYLLTDFEHASVADVMRPGVMTCPPETPLRDVARMMATHRIHCVVVSGAAQEASGERLVWRLVTDLDIARAAGEGRRHATAGDIASAEALTIAPSDPISDAARLMAERAASHLVVATNRARGPVGVLSTLDIAQAVAWSANR